jgi:hypothetical protein
MKCYFPPAPSPPSQQEDECAQFGRYSDNMVLKSDMSTAWTRFEHYALQAQVRTDKCVFFWPDTCRYPNRGQCGQWHRCPDETETLATLYYHQNTNNKKPHPVFDLPLQPWLICH